MRPIWSIATTAFRESIRNRTLLAILLLAAGFIVSALLLAELALDQRVRVILDWGLFCVSAFGVLLAILVGVSQVHKEVRRKNLYVVISRPIHRWQYVLGKYLGLALTLLVEVAALTGALLLLLTIEGIAPSVLLWQALVLILFEILLVAALAVFFASISSPALSGLFTFGLFVVGRSLPVLDKLSQQTDNGLTHALLKGLVWILPDLSAFNQSTRVVHELPIGWGQVGFGGLYALAYGAILIGLAAWIFSRKDLV